ncbi:hypothetical protein [Synechococcus sp. Cu2B8-bc1011]|uniref:hypothetical protein n=1 Tax=Synechococcus sp. Cu2B8-bc1011 TaxID=3093725 RepID=UPI0039AF6842
MTALNNSKLNKGDLEFSGEQRRLSSHTMKRSLPLLSALTLGSSALLCASVSQAKAMAIAFDCFNRETEQLVARSSVDMTTMAVTCLPVSQSASHSSENNDDGIIHISNEENTSSEDWDDEDYLDNTAEDDNLADQSEFDDNNDFDDDDYTEEDIADNSEYENPSSGDQLGEALGNHLGKLIGQGFADLLNK